jgi:hypothetical protein
LAHFQVVAHDDENGHLIPVIYGVAVCDNRGRAHGAVSNNGYVRHDGYGRSRAGCSERPVVERFSCHASGTIRWSCETQLLRINKALHRDAGHYASHCFQESRKVSLLWLRRMPTRLTQ